MYKCITLEGTVSGAKANYLVSGFKYSLNDLFHLQAELVDVQYGTVEDLVQIRVITNVTNKIALLKLGQSPLLYKVSSMSTVH